MSTLIHRTQKYIQAICNVHKCISGGKVYMVLGETEQTYRFRDDYGNINEINKDYFKVVK